MSVYIKANNSGSLYSRIKNSQLREYNNIFLNSNLIESNNRLKYRFLNERFGVFDYDEKYYLKLFKDIIIKGTDTLIDNKDFNDDLVKLYKNSDTLYFKYELHNLGFNDKRFSNIDTLKIYFTINESSPDFYTVTNNSSDNNFENSELPLYNKNNDKIIVSIVLQFNQATFKNYNIDEIAGILLHELLHIMHLNFNVIENTENANYISYDVGKIKRIPNYNDILNVYNELKNNNWQLKNIEPLNIFISICIYYCDLSERSAFISNFMVDVEKEKNNLKNLKDKTYIQYFFDINHSEIFPRYFLLFSIFKKFYKVHNSNISFDKSLLNDVNELYDNLLFKHHYKIKNYLKDIKRYKGISNLNDMCSMWRKAIYKWCNNAKKIMDNYQNKLKNR